MTFLNYIKLNAFVDIACIVSIIALVLKNRSLEKRIK